MYEVDLANTGISTYTDITRLTVVPEKYMMIGKLLNNFFMIIKLRNIESKFAFMLQVIWKNRFKLYERTVSSYMREPLKFIWKTVTSYMKEPFQVMWKNLDKYSQVLHNVMLKLANKFKLNYDDFLLQRV